MLPQTEEDGRCLHDDLTPGDEMRRKRSDCQNLPKKKKKKEYPPRLCDFMPFAQSEMTKLI